MNTYTTAIGHGLLTLWVWEGVSIVEFARYS